MKYYSLNNPDHLSSFEDAVLRGLAPDKGLYFPSRIPKLSSELLKDLRSKTRQEIAYEAIKDFVGDEIPRQELERIITHTLDFEFPMVKLEASLYSLELFHGPTMAFKDVGARFMAGCLEYFIKKGDHGRVTVLVATSGDTGGAVASGFLGAEHIDVVILYPKGKVSDIQEKQLTTLGENIKALEVDGSFDDCQDYVKKAFLDEDIKGVRILTSANSINIARWLPQMFYYFLAYQQLMPIKKPLVVSVPSGNFGNICSGLLAREMGLPIDHFVAANNTNDVVTRYLDTSQYDPKPSVQTLSNAMDVGNPSNFVRILELFSNKHQDLKKGISSYSYSDDQTKSAIKEVYDRTGYILDPHGAVGYLGLRDHLKTQPEALGVFLETAHPVKFLDTVESVLQREVEIPGEIQRLKDKEKQAAPIADYEGLKSFLMN